MPNRPAKQATHPERMVKKFVIHAWPVGLSHAELADQLEYVAGLLRTGYFSGRLISEENAGGSWDTIEA